MTRPDLGLTCVEVVELVTDYLESALSGDERSRFEEHLAICHGCRSYIEQMRATIRALNYLRNAAGS